VRLWNRYFHGDYLAVRAYMFSKVFLCMVALDTWMLMIGHAGRYGVASFNVAHFALLQRVLPLPTAAHYVATLLLTGLVALTAALLGPRKLLMSLLFVLYTYSWSMSMLDSYQHHYFVSLVLLCMVFFPKATRDSHTSGFGYPLLAATITLLYTFTSIAKMDAQWCDGFTLRRISSAQEVLAPLVNFATQLGISEPIFWSIASTSVIPVELLIAVGYALSARQDDTQRRWLRWYVAITFPIAIALHLGAEALRLDIGWFSYYMLALACTFLLPGRAVQVLALAITVPAQAVAKFLTEAEPTKVPSRAETGLICAAVSGVLGAAAFLLDLPGAYAASALAALGLWGYAIATNLRANPKAPNTTHVGLALGVAAVLMWTAIAVTEVRWDYYRYLGGDLQRRGESREALSAYLKGERYAPKGSSRKNKIRQLQRELGLKISP
jgi:hypothetical protein